LLPPPPPLIANAVTIITTGLLSLLKCFAIGSCCHCSLRCGGLDATSTVLACCHCQFIVTFLSILTITVHCFCANDKALPLLLPASMMVDCCLFIPCLLAQ